MKRIVSMLVMLLVISITYSQVDVKSIFKKKSKERAERRTGEGVDKGLDKAEKGVKELFKKKKKEEDEKSEDPNESSLENDEPESGNSQVTANQGPGLKWAKYDFVPGNEIIFEDDQAVEENGEFPSRWDLVAGRVENAVFDSSKVIYFMTASSSIIPYLKNRESDYIPEEFTLEFDAWFEADEYTGYDIWFADTKNQTIGEGLHYPILKIYANAVVNEKNKGMYTGEDYEWNTERSYWRHVSISFNRRALKVYLDDTRIINVPNMEINPTGMRIGIDGFGTAGVKGLNRFMKNIRLAKGAVKLYDKLQQDGKIVSTGIRFDTGKSTIKPESMGVLNKIYALLKDHPEVTFSVEGHTDHVGDEDYNLKLSEKRAEAVVNKLVEMGISKDRFASKGLGESVPVSSNDTPEGKANNRRVEFVKM